MKPPVSKKVGTGFGLALIISAVNISVSYHNTLPFIATNNSVVHALEVLQEIESVLSNLKDAESGQHGYIIMGEPSYLEPYHPAFEAVPQNIQALKQLTADNPHPQQRLDMLDPLITKKLTNSSETIVLHRNQGFEGIQLQLVSLMLTKPRENQRITYA
jgi:CHASE3 domain sensor protein